MGNYTSCTLPAPTTRGTKVFFPSGEARRIYEPTKAAELMLESPNHFLTNAKNLKPGTRLSPLNADEDLEMGSVYVFFPMKRLNTPAKAEDLKVLLVTGKRLSRIAPCGGDVAQVVESVTMEKRRVEECMEEILALEFQHRLSVCRSKKPLLETIVEEEEGR